MNYLAELREHLNYEQLFIPLEVLRLVLLGSDAQRLLIVFLTVFVVSPQT